MRSAVGHFGRANGFGDVLTIRKDALIVVGLVEANVQSVGQGGNARVVQKGDVVLNDF